MSAHQIKTSLKFDSKQGGQMIEDDESLWGRVMNEANGIGRREGLWAKCFAKADGNENRAKAEYMNRRVAELKSQKPIAASAIQAEAIASTTQAVANELHPQTMETSFAERAMGECPNCTSIIDLDLKKCPHCSANFENAAWSIKPLPAGQAADLSNRAHPGSTAPVATSEQRSPGSSTNEPILPEIPLFSIQGRRNRLSYLGVLLATSIVSAIGFAFIQSDAPVIGILIVIPMFLFTATAAIQRLHDLELSGWYYLVFFIPLINIFLGIYTLFGPGTTGPNQFGRDPLEPLTPEELAKRNASTMRSST